MTDASSKALARLASEAINRKDVSLLVDGKVVEHYGVTDWATALGSMGLLPHLPANHPGRA